MCEALNDKKAKIEGSMLSQLFMVFGINASRL
jgi:hypothetical protein